MIGLEIPWKKLVAHREALEPALRVAMEIQRRNEHPYYQWEPDDHPQRNQLAFHQSPALIRLVFGGNQSGKSITVAHEAAWFLNGEHPWQRVPRDCRIYVISANYRTIQEGVWRHLREIIPDWQIEEMGPFIAPWKVPAFVRVLAKDGTVHQADFITGEGREDARKKIQAAAINLVIIDEEVDRYLYEEANARMLRFGGRMVVSATLMNSEPWCLDLENEAVTGSEDVELFRFSTYRARDCGHVDAKQVQRIAATFAAEDVEVRLSGHSRKNQGLVYPDFDAKNVYKHFEPPKEWTRYCVLDPGHGQSTFAVLWAAVSPDNRVWLYRELYQHSRMWFDIAKEIFAAEGYRMVKLDPPFRRIGSFDVKFSFVPTEKTETIRYRLCDPSSFGHETSGEPKTATFLGLLGLKCSEAMNDVQMGIELVRAAMSPMIGGQPQLMVSADLKNWLAEVRDYRFRRDTSGHNAHGIKVVPRKKKDHLMDCTRYLFMSDLKYVPPRAIQDFSPPVEFSTPMGEKLKQDFEKTMRRLRTGEGRGYVEHPCGLGSEY